MRTTGLKTEQKKREAGGCGKLSRGPHARTWEQEIVRAAQTTQTWGVSQEPASPGVLEHSSRPGFSSGCLCCGFKVPG